MRELRQNASRFLALVKSGERIGVTERGKLVAYLVPAERPGSVLDQLRAEGKVREAKGNLLDLPPPPPPDDGLTASEVLAQMRDEERW